MRGGKYKKVEIKLDNTYSGRPNLSIELFPSTDEFLKTSYSNLKNWANKYEPSLVVKIWAKSRFYAWALWANLLWITLWVTLANSSSTNMEYKDKAKSLVDGGLSDQDISLALELILRDKFNIPFRAPPEFSFGWMGVVLWCGLLVCILISFKPTLIIGVGKAEKKLKYWRRWISFISYSVPLFLISVIATSIMNRYLM